MAGFGQTLRVALANAVLRNTAYSSPATVYVSLHTGDPGVDGQTANEVSTSGTAYGRVAVTFGAPTAASPSVATSNAAVTYNTATGSGFGTVTHFGLWNNLTLGAAANFIGGAALTASQSVAAGNTASFASGAITHTFTG